MHVRKWNELQLNLIVAQCLLTAAIDLVPSRSATDSGLVEGELGRCVVVVGNRAVHVSCLELGGLRGLLSSSNTVPQRDV